MTLDLKVNADPAAAVFANREFGFTRQDFQKIIGMLHADAGILLSETKAPLVYSRLVKRLRVLGVGNFARYCALVESAADGVERQEMVSALTTNVTSFFREPHHFEHLKAQVLPQLLEPVRRGGRLRIWSAGCSTGEEPYSIALSILEAMPDAASLDVRVLATDINQTVLTTGETGQYDERALAPVSRRLLADWFVSTRGADGRKTLAVGADLRALVTFRSLNLREPWPMTLPYQAVFCRNVLIYFDDAGQADVQQRIGRLLTRSGRLYLGASERIKHSGDLRLDGVTTYCRGGLSRPISDATEPS
ncbi:MAG: chemotaxis protein [Caulobacteraceae bacterium]|nr:chemotaxis protein [Caulobacteraceae bacterium]